MSRQSRRVLLLLLCIGVASAVFASTPKPDLHIVRDDIPDNQLFSDDYIDPEDTPKPQHIRISTPKVKDVPIVPTTTSVRSESSTAASRQRTLSDNMLSDLVEASKHSEALSKDER